MVTDRAYWMNPRPPRNPAVPILTPQNGSLRWPVHQTVCTCIVNTGTCTREHRTQACSYRYAQVLCQAGTGAEAHVHTGALRKHACTQVPFGNTHAHRCPSETHVHTGALWKHTCTQVHFLTYLGPNSYKSCLYVLL